MAQWFDKYHIWIRHDITNFAAPSGFVAGALNVARIQQLMKTGEVDLGRLVLFGLKVLRMIRLNVVLVFSNR
jgi:hypothetical protein